MMMMMSTSRRSLVVRFVLCLTATALFVSIFTFYEESFLQRFPVPLHTAASINISSVTTTTTTSQEENDSSFLNVRPIGLKQCTTVRFRQTSVNSDEQEEEESSILSYTVDEAMQILRQQPYSKEKLRVGLVFVENPTDFVSLSKGVFHLFHFLEFLVIAFTELHRLDVAAAILATTGGAAAATTTSTTTTTVATTITSSFTAIQVPWLYVPLLTPQEICGSAHGINCLILQIILTASIPTMPSSSQSLLQTQHAIPIPVQIFGVESNDNATRQVHEAFRGSIRQRRRRQTPNNAVDPVRQAELHHSSSPMAAAADLVLLVDRQSCKREQKQRIQKIWTNYIADNNNNNIIANDGLTSRRFPAELWHAAVKAALGGTIYPPSGLVVMEQGYENDSSATIKSTHYEPPTTTVCYIDRQGTSRRLPDTFHEWLIDYLQSHPRMDFVHLHMENYAALDQLRLAASCRILLGVHGNGLSHVAWMEPGSVHQDATNGAAAGAVVEFFFDYPFYYDYATLSQLFGLRYFALWNGHVLDAQRIAQRDPFILKETRPWSNQTTQTSRTSSFAQEVVENPRAVAERLRVAQAALQDFLESSLN